MSKMELIKCVDILHSILLRGICIVDRSSKISSPLLGRVKGLRASIYASASSKVIMGKNISLKRCKLIALKNSRIVIHDNVKLENVEIKVSGGGIVEIFENSIVSGYVRRITWKIDSGKFILGHHSRVSHNMWIRYGGIVNIGQYTCVNQGSEIRCDESIQIGSYSQISYNVNIWDTNTHSIYRADERRRLTETKGIGYEFEKPKTSPISIGDDCWIGKNSAILKGSVVGNKCIIGYGTTIINKQIADNVSVVNKIEIKQFSNKV